MDASYLTGGVVGGGSSALVFGILLYVYKHGIRSECCGNVISAGRLDAQATPVAADTAPPAATAVAPRIPDVNQCGRNSPALALDVEAPSHESCRSSVHTPVRPAALRSVLPPLHPLHERAHPETPMKKGRVSPGTDMYRLP